MTFPVGPTFAMGPALLFCPGNRPDRFDKAAQRSDAVILDLEDAVGPGDKAAAREAVIAQPLDPARAILRVNAVRSGEFDADLQALAHSGYRTVMLPKTESAEDVAALAGSGVDVVALIETAMGVQAVAEIAAAPGVVALVWGAEDLVASLGGTSSRHPDGTYRDVARHARSAVLLAAGAHGKAAIDAVHTDLADHEGLRAEAEDAAAVGFAATACLHPDHVGIIRDAYRPSDDRLAWAQAVLAAAEHQPGVFTYEGQMIDEPILALARRVVAARWSIETQHPGAPGGAG